jgi:(E)-4-hydroxy-3-methylbut-2-enyl-diphosphate synthase
MTSTDTADPIATAEQAVSLWQAGSDLVRVTVNTDQAAQEVPEIKQRMLDAGCDAPLIGDFHYNGHLLLQRHPDCARALDKYRINPGNVGVGSKHDPNFESFCRIAKEQSKPVRIGVNSGSVDEALLSRERHRAEPGESQSSIINRCMVESALSSTETALSLGLREDQIVISCKASQPRDLLWIYRELASRTRQTLHLGLTEAGMGIRGLMWSAGPLAILLHEGIGDTIRVSLTTAPAGDRRDEVVAACELLQALGLRRFWPTVTSCPGCGRTTSETFRRLALTVQEHLRERMQTWRQEHQGVENLTLAVMGCVVNGPGESRSADLGISLPGSGEEPRCPVYVDGVQVTSLKGDAQHIAREFCALVDDYVRRRFPERQEDG